MTFLQMQTDALDIIQDWQQHGDYSLTKLKHYLNIGNREFVRKARMIEGTIDVTSVANQFAYTQTDKTDLQYLYKPQAVKFIEDASSKVGRPLNPWPGGYSRLPEDLIYSSTPDFYWLRNIAGRTISTAASTGAINRTGVSFGVWPVLDTSSLTIRIEAFLFPATMTADTHIPEYDEAYHDAPVFFAAYRILWLFAEKLPSARAKAIECKQTFDSLVTEAKSALSTNDFALMGVPDIQDDIEGW